MIQPSQTAKTEIDTGTLSSTEKNEVSDPSTDHGNLMIFK